MSLRGRLRLKISDFEKFWARTVELHSMERLAHSNQRSKLEEVLSQLYISGKKGAHALVVKEQLQHLSKHLSLH